MFRSDNKLVEWILAQLPMGAELLYLGKRTILQYTDEDYDGINEIFGVYRINQESYLFVLKNYCEPFSLYFPFSYEMEKKAVRALPVSLETRTVYLFPAPMKEVDGNKWGYINEKGRFILPPKYEQASDFQDNGLAIIRSMDHTGVINANGYFIVYPKYDTIHPFSEGRATVIEFQGFKVIDESGKEITSKAYSYIGDFKEGRAIMADTDENGQYLYGFLNKGEKK